ncbi:MAG: TIM-barrel domain-containing protein, partial [Solirubrobacteraceae bacterium]
TGQPNVVSVEEEAQIAQKLRDADAPVSVAETQMHYLPCGAHRGNEALEQARTDSFHAFGLARLVYFNPSVCRSYSEVYDEAAAAGALQRDATGQPFTYTSFVGGSGPLGFTLEPLAQFDFTAPAAEQIYERLVRAALAVGHDGFMEDFGENTPPMVSAADGTPGEQLHNRYPTDYHCAVRRIQERFERPIVRFQRSGWTSAAACADVVWGGDPTTVWGYDGLQSAVRQALSMGLSGVARWGSDIGGYHSFGPDEQLSEEMLKRWIEFGAVSAVMRTKRSGLAVPSYDRPQVFDDEILPVWRRYTKLHTQLNAYLLGADAQYRATGMPIMRALALVFPREEALAGVEDAFMLGDALLAAPVVEEGATKRSVALPAGRWVDLSQAFEHGSGGLALRRPRVLQGGRVAEIAAPLDVLPLFARAGALVALLEPDVDTLAPYGTGVVHATDRAGRMRILAFPRGRSAGRFNAGERLAGVESSRGWTLRVSGERVRTYRLQAAFATLRRPFRPCAVRGARAWSFRGGVLRVTFRTKRGSVTVLRRC